MSNEAAVKAQKSKEAAKSAERSERLKCKKCNKNAESVKDITVKVQKETKGLEGTEIKVQKSTKIGKSHCGHVFLGRMRTVTFSNELNQSQTMSTGCQGSLALSRL